MNADLGIFRRLRDQRRADIGVAADKAGIVGADKLDPDPSMIRISSANLSRSRRWETPFRLSPTHQSEPS
jgi:hypothetical protein